MSDLKHRLARLEAYPPRAAIMSGAATVAVIVRALNDPDTSPARAARIRALLDRARQRRDAGA